MLRKDLWAQFVIKMFIYSSGNWFYCTASVCLLLLGGEPLSADLGKFRFVYSKNIYIFVMLISETSVNP